MKGHAQNVKVERGSTFDVYERPFIHCLYFIYSRNIYVRTHVKIMRQWAEIHLYPSQCLTGKNTDRLAVKKRRSFNTELGAV